jgi:hypothetical protein
MTILFAASEVGSVRALAPVAEICAEKGAAHAWLDLGAVPGELVSGGLVPCPAEPEDFSRLFRNLGIRLVAFSSNLADPRPLSAARAAAACGLPTVHVLDYWNGYVRRMALDGLPPFRPTVYAVPDEPAARQARAEGVAPDSLIVTGQPAMADAREAFEAARAKGFDPAAAGLDPEVQPLLFVSEPVSNDQGRSLEESPEFRGYTEETVLALFIEALKRQGCGRRVLVLPHPREDAGALSGLWRSLGGEAHGVVLPGVRGRDLLPFTRGVAGMASTLLYEAWLAGLPVASIQPGLGVASLRTVGEREGILFLDRPDGAADTLADWLSGLSDLPAPGYFREEYFLHLNAAENLYELIRKMIDSGQGQCLEFSQSEDVR